MCREICERLGIEHSTFPFESGEVFWREFSSGARYDLLLFDIMMDETNGMELARNLREYDESAAIIFITSSPDFAVQGYDVNALHYLIKPPDIEVLERLISSDYNNRFKSNFLVFKSGGQILQIPIRDIICLETVGRRVEITLHDRTVEYSGKLSDLLEELEGLDSKEQFVRSHKAFAINISSIRELTKSDAIAMNGKAIPVSRTYMKQVQHALLKQIRDD